MRLAFKPLGALGLGIDGESVGQAFQPFLCTGPGHGRYDELTRYLRRKAVKKAFRRLYSGEGGLKSRKRDIILDEYESAWSRGHSAYDLSLGCQRPEPWIHGEHKFLADRAGVPRFRSVIITGANALCFSRKRNQHANLGNKFLRTRGCKRSSMRLPQVIFINNLNMLHD
jgi:hypothetical protein